MGKCVGLLSSNLTFCQSILLSPLPPSLSHSPADTDTCPCFFHVNLLLGSKVLELLIYSFYLPLIFCFLFFGGVYVFVFLFLIDFLAFATVFFPFPLIYYLSDFELSPV